MMQEFQAFTTAIYGCSILNSAKQGKLRAINCKMSGILLYIVSAALARETSCTVPKLRIMIVL